MKRTLVGFSDQDIQELDSLSALRRVSRAELIRQAVSQYLQKLKTAESPDLAFGLWANKAEDGLAYQQRLRDEW
ncbi:MAG: ribbon-helix-helix protein, CopG family [Rhodoferax sp.]|jgi:metal-responsive CopG/Arc/MetJ family transcriptional regulator|nr:ribbon-helix-helix protein, CopG family [Rhodoferax sp.]